MGKFLSKDEGIATIQCEMIERVLDIIIKGCDYSFNGGGEGWKDILP